MADEEYDVDEEFPKGDGTVESSANAVCPYCGESVLITVDPGGGSVQEYVEDCSVCCNPWQVSVQFIEGMPAVEISSLDA